MSDVPFLANLCSTWLCCLQPIAMFSLGLWVGRHGGVRPAINNLLDRMGVPRIPQ